MDTGRDRVFKQGRRHHPFKQENVNRIGEVRSGGSDFKRHCLNRGQFDQQKDFKCHYRGNQGYSIQSGTGLGLRMKSV